MNKIIMFLTENYVWILVVIVLIIVTIIGFLADKKQSPKKIKINEDKPSVSMEVPTFVRDSDSEKKVENQFAWNNIPTTTDIPKEKTENNIFNNGQKLPEEKQNQFINPQMNMLNNGINLQKPINNNINNQQPINNIANVNNYSNGVNLQSQSEQIIPRPIQNIETLNIPERKNDFSMQNTNNNINGINPQMNMLNNGMQSQNPMNNYNNINNNINNQQPINNRANVNNYLNGVNMQQQKNNPQMNMLNSGMQSQNPMNNYNNINNNINNQQPINNSGTIPQPINMMQNPQQQPIMNNQRPLNNSPVNEPIKVTPIAGVTENAVLFVNGPINSDSSQN